MEVKRITYEQTKDWLLIKHYAHRMPSISYAFGLYEGDYLCGIVCYGKPPSPSLCKGLCGEEYSQYVLELSRLAINSDAPKNSASFLVGNSIKKLPKDTIVVSFADTAMNHNGYIYQASNFIYTGLSAKRTEWAVRGKEHIHAKSLADQGSNTEGKRNIDVLKERYGDDFYYRERSRKHRYVFFRNRRFLKFLKYPVLPYPKEESLKYTCVDIKETK